MLSDREQKQLLRNTRILSNDTRLRAYITIAVLVVVIGIPLTIGILLVVLNILKFLFSGHL